MNTRMNKRKTRNWPNMYPRKKRVYPSIPLLDCLTVAGDCVHCVSEPICNNPQILDYGKI